MAQSPLHALSQPPQVVMPQVLAQVTSAGQLTVQSNIPSPGAWPQIVRLLLQALHTAHEEEVREAQQAGEQPRIVVPHGVVG